MAWLRLQWNVPSRTDYQIARVAQRVAELRTRDPKLSDQIVSFKEPSQKKLDKKQLTQQLLGQWTSWVGLKK